MRELFQDKFNIQSTRLRGWNYTSSGFYFVTICTHNRIECLGEVLQDDGEEYSVALSPMGEIVWDELLKTVQIRPNVALDEWIIMPNHVHAIFVLRESKYGGFVETPRRGVSTGETNIYRHPEWKPGVLGSIINQFKGMVTRQCLESGYDFRWQSRFYDHIIRNEMALNKIRLYIRNNPRMWYRDRNNPEGLLI